MYAVTIFFKRGPWRLTIWLKPAVNMTQLKHVLYIPSLRPLKTYLIRLFRSRRLSHYANYASSVILPNSAPCIGKKKDEFYIKVLNCFGSWLPDTITLGLINHGCTCTYASFLARQFWLSWASQKECYIIGEHTNRRSIKNHVYFYTELT